MITVKQSTDYARFRHHDHNRNVTNTATLEASMKRFGFDPGLPIRVVRDGLFFKITHGHHRFEVAKRLRIPFWYIVAEQELPLFESEASAHAWTVKDYVEARRRADEPESVALMEYHELTGIPIQSCAALLAGHLAYSGLQNRRIKDGTYSRVENTLAYNVAEAVLRLKEGGIAWASKAAFIGALSKCMLVPEFDWKSWVEKAIKNPKCKENFKGTMEAAMQLIEDVHNWQVRKDTRIPLSFMANQAAAARNVVGSKKETNQ